MAGGRGHRGPELCPVNNPYVGVRSSWIAPFVTQATSQPEPGRFGESFNPIVPVRIVDSRADPPNGLGVDFIPPTVDDPRALGIFKPVPKLPAEFVVRRPLYGSSGVPGLPVGNLAGVVLNVTVEGPESGGFVVVYPCADGSAPTSNLNFVPGQTVANLVVTKVDRNGDICLRAAGEDGADRRRAGLARPPGRRPGPRRHLTDPPARHPDLDRAVRGWSDDGPAGDRAGPGAGRRGGRRAQPDVDEHPRRRLRHGVAL